MREEFKLTKCTANGSHWSFAQHQMNVEGLLTLAQIKSDCEWIFSLLTRRAIEQNSIALNCKFPNMKRIYCQCVIFFLSILNVSHCYVFGTSVETLKKKRRFNWTQYADGKKPITIWRNSKTYTQPKNAITFINKSNACCGYFVMRLSLHGIALMCLSLFVDLFLFRLYGSVKCCYWGANVLN